MLLNDSRVIKASFIPYEKDEGYIFVSYAHKDSQYVVPVLERMNEEGYRIWYDDGIMPGSEWPENVAEHLSNCTAVLSFVSPESLKSANCRREVTYALSKMKPFLGVFLRETKLSPGMEMQLSAQQCILKYNYPDEEDFYRKLFSSTILSACKNEKTQVSPPEKPVHEKIQPAEAAASNAPVPHSLSSEEQPAVSREPAAQLPSAAEQPAASNGPAPKSLSSVTMMSAYNNPSKEKKPGRWKRVLLTILGLIVLIIAAFGIISSIQTRKRLEEQKAREEERAEAARIEAAALPREIFFGKLLLTYSAYSDLRNAPSMQQTSGENRLDLVTLPYSMEVNPDTPDRMILEFQDKFGHLYKFSAEYTLSEGILSLSAPAEAEAEEEISPLSDNLKYNVAFSGGSIRLAADDTYRKYTNEGTTDTLITLQGTANSEKDIYEEILSLDFSGAEDDENRTCLVFYEGGGYSLDAVVSSLRSYFITITVNNEMVAYNGYMQEASCNKRHSFDFINTYPYGFIIKDGNDYYFYQDAVMKAEEE